MSSPERIDDSVAGSATAEVLRAAMPSARSLLPAIAFGVLGAGSAVALLATSMWLIVRAAEMPPILFLTFAVVGVRAFALGRAFFRYLERLAGHEAVLGRLPRLRARVFERLIPLAPSGLARAGRGDLLSRLVRDTDELQFFPLRAVLPAIVNGVVLVAATVVVLLCSPGAGAVLLGCLAAGGALAFAITDRAARAADGRIARLRGDLSDRVLDLVDGIDVLVAFGADGRRQAAARAASERLRTAEARHALAQGAATAVISLFAGIAVLGALPFAAAAAQEGALTGPAAAVVILLPVAVFELLAIVPAAVSARRRARASAERIASVVPADPPAGVAVDPADAVALPADRPGLVLRGVRARYPGAGVDALAGVDLDVPAGARLVLRGPSGSGKSTVGQVLARFLDYEGSVLIGGVEARAAAGRDVRSRIVLCEQQPWLFDADVRTNLRFADPGADDARLLAVLARVGLADWVHERGGLDARVGERGALVAGGQAQRIALARALLSGAPVLVFDEPTANVEPELGAALLRDILALAPERTVILITHGPVPDGFPHREVRIAAGRTVGERPVR